MFTAADKIYSSFQILNRPSCKRELKKLNLDSRLTFTAVQRKQGSAKYGSLTPVEIISVKWTDYNNPDIIVFKTVFDGIYMIQDEELLKEINKFMKKCGLHDRLPYIHVNGKDGRECYNTPDNMHILNFLRANFNRYDVYTIEGSLVKTANYLKR